MGQILKFLLKQWGRDSNCHFGRSRKAASAAPSSGGKSGGLHGGSQVITAFREDTVWPLKMGHFIESL